MSEHSALPALREATAALKGTDWQPSVELACTLVEAAQTALAQSQEVGQAVEVRRGLALAEHLFKLRGARLVESNLLVAQRLRTEWQLGQTLPDVVSQGGGMKKKSGRSTSLLADLGLTKDQSSDFQRVAQIEEDTLERHLAMTMSVEELSTVWALKLFWFLHGRSARARDAGPLPPGRFRAIVIDPPWPMQRIDRDVRDRQPDTDLDYPTMSLDDIAALPVPDKAADDGCHVYLWTTQRFLHEACDLFERWGVHQECQLTWVKPTGMTPYSWMYNTEHVLFGRLGGNLPLQRFGLKLSFEAPQTGHSRKPDVFYERVLEASPGPRLEMFARTPRDGFVVWGNEVVEAAGGD